MTYKVPRQRLYEAFSRIQKRWGFCSIWSDRRGREQLIESVAHELAHAIELDFDPPPVAELKVSDYSSRRIDSQIKMYKNRIQDGHEIRALAVEVLGLRWLDYSVQLRSLAAGAIYNLRVKRRVGDVMRMIERSMETQCVNTLVRRFLLEVLA